MQGGHLFCRDYTADLYRCGAGRPAQDILIHISITVPLFSELRHVGSVELLENWKLKVSATTYETNKEAVDQTDAEDRSDLFRVHLLRRRGLIERNYLTPKNPG